MNFLIIFAAKYLFVIVCLVAGLYAFWSKQEIRVKIIKLTLISFPLVFILAKILNHLISSPRPFIVTHITPLVHSSIDNGFPSDHTLLSMAVASVIFAYNKKLGVLLIVLAVLVGIGRVLAHVHHTIDILGSIGIACSLVFVSYRYILPRLKFKIPYLES